MNANKNIADKVPSEQTVFVLDDEPAVRDSLRCLLETEHYKVETFDSPNQFLQANRPHQCACLILDLKMPQMQGLDVLKIVMQHPPRLPTIVLTAYAEVPAIVTAMKSGAVNLLEKPCHDEQLLVAVREALDESDKWNERHSSSSALDARISKLSVREREILNDLVAGLSIKQVALKLGTSPNTVRNQRTSILEKMEVDSLANLVRIILEGRPNGEFNSLEAHL